VCPRPRNAAAELAEFLAPFEVHFVQRPSAKSLERYVTGLLTEHPTKNCDTLAQVLPMLYAKCPSSRTGDSDCW
jgi:hypothetical protein